MLWNWNKLRIITACITVAICLKTIKKDHFDEIS